MLLIFLFDRLWVFVELVFTVQIGPLHLPKAFADHDVAVHVNDGGVVGFGLSEPSKFLFRELDFLRVLLRKLSKLFKRVPEHVSFLTLPE